MLVLTRDEGESIMIGDDIEITLIRSAKGKARIGVSAPRDVAVDRTEIRVLKEQDACGVLDVHENDSYR